MAATEPTRNNWDSVDDGLWADAAAAADAESAPNNAEKGTGHVQNTGYTSGRANYLWAMVAEWLQRVRNTLLPQHDDSGGHHEVTVTGDSGDDKITITSEAGEVGTTNAWVISNTDMGTSSAYCDIDGNSSLLSLIVGDQTNGPSSDPKLLVQATSTDASSDNLIETEDETGTVVLAVTVDGKVEPTGRSLSFGVAPASFHAATDNTGANDSSGVYVIEGSAFDGYMNINNSNTYRVFCPEQRLNVGDVIDTITLYANRSAGSCVAYLQYKTGTASKATIATITIDVADGSGNLTDSASPAYTVLSGGQYYWEVEITNGGTAGDIDFQSIEINITRHELL